jgi:hypothetical protein
VPMAPSRTRTCFPKTSSNFIFNSFCDLKRTNEGEQPTKIQITRKSIGFQ